MCSLQREAALEDFYQFAKPDALVLNKWFAIQASSDLPDVLDRVKVSPSQHFSSNTLQFCLRGAKSQQYWLVRPGLGEHA